MLPFESAFRGRRVLVTGHTGFKGSWLSIWLTALGAEVHGIALAPNTDPALFQAAGLEDTLSHTVLDIRARQAVIEKIVAIDPEIVFHLAAQPLVRLSYDEPLDTFETNILGTAYVLEGCRQAPAAKAIVCVTTDKVYENNEWIWPYREVDKLGGKDPYSASKAAAEMVASCFRQTLMKDGPALATARGGNVIGGGDWSADRIVPDLVRAIAAGENLAIRNPQAMRPWQHVLALCHGYLQLAAGLLADRERFEGGWNFGPGDSGTATVRTLLDLFGSAWTLPAIVEQAADGRPESQLLALDSAKAHHTLGWRPGWRLDEAVARTAQWYRGYAAEPAKALELTRGQIDAYRAAAATEFAG